MSANCNCTVKQELSLDPEKGNFKSYIMSTFLDLNFGVIKCYNLVFSFAGKLKNAGFWIFGAMVVSHIPMYILYLIKGTTTVTRYINKEMEKKGYSTKKENILGMKLSKVGLNYTVNTPKQMSSAYSNVGINPVLEHGNISVKKNSRLGIQNAKNSPFNDRRINSNENKENNNKNDFVEYVNNDKHNFNCNILNKTQNYDKSKYIFVSYKIFDFVLK